MTVNRRPVWGLPGVLSNQVKPLSWIALVMALCAGLFSAQVTVAAERYDLWRVYEIAKEYDAEHRQRLADISSRKTGFESSISGLLPRLSISGDITHSKDNFDLTPEAQLLGFADESDGTTRRVGLNVDQALLDLNAVAEYKQARAALRGLTAEAKALDQQFILAVVEAYFNTLSAQVDLTVAEEQERSFEQQLKNIQERNRAGVARTADVRDAQARLDNAAIETIVARSNLDLAAEELLLRTGVYVDWLPDLKPNLEIKFPVPNSMEAWLKLAEENSPRLVIGDANVRQANVRRKQARRVYYPTARLIGSYSGVNGSDLGASISEQTSADISLRVEMPLFLGGRLIKDIQRTTIDWVGTREANIFERRSLERDIASYYKLLVTEVARVSAQERAVASSISALKSSQLGYENGLRTILDVLAAQQAVAQAKRNYARARHDYVRRYVNLMVRAGTQDEAKLKEINRWLVTE